MPNPSREQFEAVARRAPAGLSREEFMSWVTQQLQGDRLGQVGQDEPDTFWGGFTNSIKKGVKDTFTGPDMMGMMDKAAHPQDLSDFLQLVIPAGANKVANMGSEILEAGQAGAKGAQPGILNRVRGFWKGVGEDINPASVAERRKGMMMEPGGAPAAAKPVVPTNGSDLYDLYKAKPAAKPMPTRGPAPVLRKAGQAPPSISATPSTIEDELMSALSERPKVDTRISSLPPEPGITDGGTIKQSGTFPKGESVGQPGGYTSGRPGVTQTVYDEGRTSTSQAAQEAAEQMRPSDRAIPQGRADELTQKLGGQQPDALEGALLGSGGEFSPEDIKDLRRLYGSEKAAEITGLSKAEILRLDPSPSRLPLDIEMKLLDDPEGLYKYLPR